MAIPHLNVKIITRSAGQSAIASAAYRSGEALYNESEKKTHDYTRKEDVRHTEIMAPSDAPSWVNDRQTLWNTVEAGEKRKDARFARTMTLALPREMDVKQNLELVREYVQNNFVKHGMVADIAIHEARSNDGGKNPHAHIMLTMRDIAPDGFSEKKNRTWDKKELLVSWRDSWEEHTNRHLEMAGHDTRISMQSYETQGKDQVPTIHMGPEASALEEQGIETRRGNRNREITQENARRGSAKEQPTKDVSDRPERRRKERTVSDGKFSDKLREMALKAAQDMKGQAWDNDKRETLAPIMSEAKQTENFRSAARHPAKEGLGRGGSATSSKKWTPGVPLQPETPRVAQPDYPQSQPAQNKGNAQQAAQHPSRGSWVNRFKEGVKQVSQTAARLANDIKSKFTKNKGPDAQDRNSHRNRELSRRTEKPQTTGKDKGRER